VGSESVVAYKAVLLLWGIQAGVAWISTTRFCIGPSERAMAGSALRIGLPGSLNDDNDPDLTEQDSPAKKQKAGGSTSSGEVTMDSLRQLLWEQAQMLLEAQKSSTPQVQHALQDLEHRQSQRMDVVESKLQQHDNKVSGIEERMLELQDRLAKVEQGSGSSAGRGPDRRATLVFGGWRNQTRKSVLLHQLNGALDGLHLKAQFDSEPFTTGLRRSIALCNFKKREGEGDDGCRARMFRILQAVNEAKVVMDGADKPLWCSFSRSPEERGRAAVAALVKKTVMRLCPGRGGDLEVEFSTGMTWIRDDQLSGMGEAPREVRNPMEVLTKAGKGWIDEYTLSKWCDVDVSAVRDIASEHRF
ncbi:unnamed protein product, partial [Symbiodinium microadriaticum]